MFCCFVFGWGRLVGIGVWFVVGCCWRDVLGVVVGGVGVCC